MFDIFIEGPRSSASERIGKQMVEELKKKGYDVLSFCHVISGIPVSILVGSNNGLDVRDDVYALSKRFGLRIALRGNYERDNIFL
ncbi:MAG: hypothetical protein V1900_01150 [Candidatus Aenigmatarchaeota archaeon]